MALEMTNLINKVVIVAKRDGYQKVGVLKALTDAYLVLRFKDGREEIISFSAIDSVHESSSNRGGQA